MSHSVIGSSDLGIEHRRELLTDLIGETCRCAHGHVPRLRGVRLHRPTRVVSVGSASDLACTGSANAGHGSSRGRGATAVEVVILADAQAVGTVAADAIETARAVESRRRARARHRLVPAAGLRRAGPPARPRPELLRRARVRARRIRRAPGRASRVLPRRWSGASSPSGSTSIRPTSTDPTAPVPTSRARARPTRRHPRRGRDRPADPRHRDGRPHRLQRARLRRSPRAPGSSR